MPAESADPSEPAVLAAERAHLAESRAALRRMREHAASLSADVTGISQDLLRFWASCRPRNSASPTPRSPRAAH